MSFDKNSPEKRRQISSGLKLNYTPSALTILENPEKESRPSSLPFKSNPEEINRGELMSRETMIRFY